MSNASVGNIYHQIINEVIEASRVDFEDQGVGEEVLEELRKVCSFFPSCFFPYVRLTHTNTRTQTFRVLLSFRSRLLIQKHCFLSSPQIAHAIRASKSVLDFVCCACLAPLPCKALLAGHAGCLGSLFAAALQGGGRWRGLRVRERRRVGRLGVRSDRRVTGCYLGLLSSTPACKIAFATPVNLPLHFDWSQLCPPSRAPKHDTRRG